MVRPRDSKFFQYLKSFTEPGLSPDLTDCAWFSEDGSYLKYKVLFSVYNFRYSVVYQCDSVGFVYQVLLQLGCKFEKLTQMILNQSYLI